MPISDLSRRGLIKQSTFDRLPENLSFYIGFDPTADSLHVGHLIQLTAAKRLAELGHQPIILIGDGTASIGDPSEKQKSRPILSDSEIGTNADGIEDQIKRLLPEAVFVRNSDWLKEVSVLGFLKNIGSCFSVNVMLRAECFKARLKEGLTFLELSYMLMQAADFLHLNRNLGCSLQVGGDDQWSNILAGVDLIRRKTNQKVFGMTLPLLVNPDGTKMGKTEKGAVWLANERTSAFDFFQFWRNIPDTEVLKCFKLLSTRPIGEIEALPLNDPRDVNAAKKLLAVEMTALVHGEGLATRVANQAERVFESGDLSTLDSIAVPNGVCILDALKMSGLAKSRTDARRLVAGGGVAVNEILVKDPNLNLHRVGESDTVVVRRGKKTIKRLRLEG